MSKRAIIIHGWGGLPEEGWRPWLRTQLERQGYDVRMPTMPNTEHPRLESWLEALQHTIGETDAEILLIGHSLGCVTILRYLETLPPNIRIRETVLVAGFCEDLGPNFAEIQPFTAAPFHWPRIRAACSRFHVIHSEDDHIVPVAYAERLAKNLHVPLNAQQGMKHFGSGDGLREIPCIPEALRH